MPAVLREAFARAGAARQDGRPDLAAATLAQALDALRAEPYGVPFVARVQLGLQLADTYIDAGQREQCRRVLLAEAGWADEIVRLIGASGSPEQRRSASAGRLQVRDRLAQVTLLGQPAPEIQSIDWVLGDPASLAELRGQVVLVEFWATWCRPCLEMFPHLNDLQDRYGARGLAILALTRYSQPAPGAEEAARREAHARERDLVQTVIAGRGLEIRVGVAPDGRLQQHYGANGVPTLALIDRRGVVRTIMAGGDQDALEREILACLAETDDVSSQV